MRIVSLFLGDPAGYVEQVHDAGGLVLRTVGSAEEARRAVASGVDVIVAQGWEAGGHVGGQIATLPLVPAVVDAVAPVPVIAAGGIGDARGVAAVLALGAQAAWVGTRFLLAQEMPIHEEYRRRLIDAVETDAEWYPDLYDVGVAGLAPPRPPQLDGRDVGGRGPAARWGVDPERAMSSRTSPRAKQSSATSQRRRWSGPPVTSKRSQCGPDRASRSPGSHNQRRRSWLSSFRACEPSRPAGNGDDQRPERDLSSIIDLSPGDVHDSCSKSERDIFANSCSRGGNVGVVQLGISPGDVLDCIVPGELSREESRECVVPDGSPDGEPVETPYRSRHP